MACVVAPSCSIKAAAQQPRHSLGLTFYAFCRLARGEDADDDPDSLSGEALAQIHASVDAYCQVHPFHIYGIAENHSAIAK